MLLVGTAIAESIILNGGQFLTGWLWIVTRPYQIQSVNQHAEVYHMFSYQRCQADIVIWVVHVSFFEIN